VLSKVFILLTIILNTNSEILLFIQRWWILWNIIRCKRRVFKGYISWYSVSTLMNYFGRKILTVNAVTRLLSTIVYPSTGAYIIRVFFWFVFIFYFPHRISVSFHVLPIGDSFRLSELLHERIPPRRYCTRYTTGRFFVRSKWTFASRITKEENGYAIVKVHGRFLPFANIFPRRATPSVGKQETKLSALYCPVLMRRSFIAAYAYCTRRILIFGSDDIKLPSLIHTIINISY